MNKIKFDELNISNEIKKAVADMGFEEASPIQEQAIPHLLEGKDIIGQSQTGTGKTAAFGIPILDKIDISRTDLQAVILVPTRELAIQVADEFKKLAKYKKNLDILPIYGGQPIDRQIRVLKRGVQIIIGTPGRVIDHLNRKTLNMDKVKIVVLDEADEMLDMGFREDIEFILHQVPTKRQTVLFSATMSDIILDLTRKYLHNPVFVKVVHKTLTVPSIEQIYFEVKEKNKPEVLSRLIDIHNPKLSLVFCNTKKGVDDLVDTLQTMGYLADGLHGDLKQAQRDRVMSKFRNGTIDILVATDVAARGIDVDDVEIVFNYDTPHDEEYYVHRIGRTGRAGRTGKAFTFVTGKDIYKIKDIQKYINTKIKLQPAPTINDVKEIRINSFLNKVKDTIENGHLNEYLHYVETFIESDYTSLDVAAALIKMALEEKERVDEEEIEDFGDTGASPGMVRLFINIGRKNKISPKDIVGNIASYTGLAGNLIGTIDIYDRFTFVEVPKEYAKEVLMIMNDNLIKGKKIIIEPANKK